MGYIEFHSVTKRYVNGYEALRDVSVEFVAGSMTFLTGHSGAGKSTFLRLLLRMEEATRGQILVNGVNITQLKSSRLPYYRRHVGAVFQDHHLLPQLSALENVLLPTLALAKKPNEAQMRASARELLAKVGLTGKEDRRPAQLSGGERQRVALARALINKPKLILADEPTGALDVANAAAVSEVLLTLNRDTGTALVVVTHSPALAARMSRQIDFARGVSA